MSVDTANSDASLPANTLGQQVAQLVNSDIDAGYHEIQFNASNLASGVYFYRIQAGTYTETKALRLIR